MPIQKRTQTLSDLTRELLKSGETEEADYKKIPAGVNSDDLVAFANSGGGQILVGVVEATENGAQIGEVIGCDVSDGAILQILNRASSCIPPVSVDIFVENLKHEPILRLSIVDSETKPHCTPKGVYCRREGTRTRALHPQEMLNIFLETEASSFAAKFEAAADKIAGDLETLEISLGQSIDNMASQLGWADSKLGDTESTIDTILAYVARIDGDTGEANKRLRAIFQQDDRIDPVREEEKRKLVSRLIQQILDNPKILKAAVEGADLSAQANPKAATDLTPDEFSAALKEATQKIRNEVDRRKYSRTIRNPSDCKEGEIDAFVNLVSRGGEVADGVRKRIMRAKALGFVNYDGVAVGVGAIKRPLKSYKKRVFESAGSTLNLEDFPVELGWIYLKENHRGKGQITPLIEEMLEEIDGKSVFATTRSSNPIMREILKHFGFKRSGHAYPSKEHPHEKILLYVRQV